MKKNFPVTGKENDWDASKVIISATDTKGITTHTNQAFRDISGFENSELIGKNHNVVRHPDVPPAAFQNLWDEIKAGRPWMGIVKNRCKNGDHYWVDAYVTPLMDGDSIVGYESVRMKPEREDVKRAEWLFERLNRGKGLRGKRLFCVSYPNRVFLSFIATTLPLIGLTALLGNISLELALGLLAFSTGLGFFFSRLITRRLVKAAKASKHIVDNPVTLLLYAGGTDEIDQLVVANKMLESRINTVLNRIGDASDRLETVAMTANSGAQDSAQGMQNQQNEITQLATAMEEMSTTVGEVARNAEQGAGAAKQASGFANDGKLTITKAVLSVDALAEEVETAANTIRKLADDSQNIGSVVDVINEIAEQTNLLALNAAIEAARAGEQGRGFAVVADEVRTLATRTQESTKEIQDMIQLLRDGIQKVVAVMATNQEQAQEGVEQVAEAGEVLANIVGAVNVINDMNAMIASATEEQSAVSEEINRNLHNINDHSKSTLSLSHHTLETSEELMEYVKGMKELIRRFNIK